MRSCASRGARSPGSERKRSSCARSPWGRLGGDIRRLRRGRADRQWRHGVLQGRRCVRGGRTWKSPRPKRRADRQTADRRGNPRRAFRWHTTHLFTLCSPFPGESSSGLSWSADPSPASPLPPCGPKKPNGVKILDHPTRQRDSPRVHLVLNGSRRCVAFHLRHRPGDSLPEEHGSARTWLRCTRNRWR